MRQQSFLFIADPAQAACGGGARAMLPEQRAEIIELMSRCIAAVASGETRIELVAAAPASATAQLTQTGKENRS